MEIQRDIDAHDRRTSDKLPQIRIGINIGEVIEEEDDLFGLSVDAAMHIQSKADPGHILVSELVRGVVGVAGDIDFEERGRFKLKNFPGRWRLYEVPWEPHEHEQKSLSCALLICDFVGMTPLFESLGDESALETILSYHAIARAELEQHEVLWLRSVADNVLAAFSRPADALTAAIDMQRGFAERNHEHPGEPLRVGIGLHVGEVIREADDLFGRALNLTSRIATLAGEGEIVASEAFKDSAGTDSSITFKDGHDVTLRGFQGTHRLYIVGWANERA
jgi:class 3 adenylate cyclase